VPCALISINTACTKNSSPNIMRLRSVASGQLWAQPWRDIYRFHRFWDPTRKNNNPTFIASHIPQLRMILTSSSSDVLHLHKRIEDWNVDEGASGDGDSNIAKGPRTRQSKWCGFRITLYNEPEGSIGVVSPRATYSLLCYLLFLFIE
jgi:hypothetical protein